MNHNTGSEVLYESDTLSNLAYLKTSFGKKIIFYIDHPKIIKKIIIFFDKNGSSKKVIFDLWWSLGHFRDF